MSRRITQSDTATRRHILRAALKVFAHRGYAAAAVQEIVSAAKVSKPAMYYYFQDKAALYQALVDEAHDDRYRVIKEAADSSSNVREKLVAILAALFDYFYHNRELTRLAFATPLAAPGELPSNLGHIPKCRRNLEFINSLMREGQARREITPDFDSWELTYGFYGQMNFHIASHLLLTGPRLDRSRAEAIVSLFFTGARAPGRSANGKPRRAATPPRTKTPAIRTE
jgi:AcrR family transcriptional regulator